MGLEPASDVHLSHKHWALRLELFRFFLFGTNFLLCANKLNVDVILGRTAFPHRCIPCDSDFRSNYYHYGKGEGVLQNREPPPEERWSEHKLITRDCQRIGKVIG